MDGLLPGSIGGWLAAMAVAFGLSLRPGRLGRVGRIGVLGVLLVHYAWSTDAGATLWSAPLTRNAPVVQSPAEAEGATAVVVLTPSGAVYGMRGVELGIVPVAVHRVLEGVRLWRLLDNPLIILQGGSPRARGRFAAGEVAKALMVQLGVPSDRIIVEDVSPTTHAHPAALRPLLETSGISRFVLVTSPDHMPRAAAVFRKAGFSFVPSASQTRSDYARARPWWVPRPDALDHTLSASHEYVGLVYYWWKGWI